MMFTEESVSARRLKSGLKPVFLTLDKDLHAADIAIEAFNSCLGKQLSEVILLAVSSLAKKKPVTGLVHALFMVQEFETSPNKKKISSLDVARVAAGLRSKQTFGSYTLLQEATAKHFDVTLERLDAILAEETEPRVYRELEIEPEALIAVYNFEYWNLLHRLAGSPIAKNWFEPEAQKNDRLETREQLSWLGKSSTFSFSKWESDIEKASEAIRVHFPRYI